MTVPKHIEAYRRRVKKFKNSNTTIQLTNESLVKWREARKNGSTIQLPVCKSFDNRGYLENLKFKKLTSYLNKKFQWNITILDIFLIRYKTITDGIARSKLHREVLRDFIHREVPLINYNYTRYLIYYNEVLHINPSDFHNVLLTT